MKQHRLMIACSAALSIPLAWVGLFSGITLAQQAPTVPPPLVQPPAEDPIVGPSTPGAPGSAEAADELQLGRTFERQSAGISFRPPADCTLTDAMSSQYLAEWADAGHDWTLKLGKMILEHDAPLTTGKDGLGESVEGVLETTIKNLKAQLPGSTLLRHDVTNTRDSVKFDSKNNPEAIDNVGLIAIRYTNKGKTRLSQQAIVRSNDGVYYLLTLTSPGSNAPPPDEKNPVEPPADPNEVLAVNTFGRMVDSIRILDRKAIVADQDERLLHTRLALVNWTPEKLHKAIMNEQWLRIIKDGKDIGYSYITEDQAGGIPRPLHVKELQDAQKVGDDGAELRHAPKGDGILIGVRTGTTTMGIRSDKTKGAIQVDGASWFFISSDKKHEDFSRVVVTDDHIAPKKGYVQEFGLSDKRVRRVFVPPPPDSKTKVDPSAIRLDGNSDVSTLAYKEDWELNVTMTSNSGNAEPLVRKLSPWYVPQALAHLLPRLLPLDKPQKYLFATYVSDAREVMERYIDVLPEQNVTFAGQQLRAIPIRDRLGLEGSVTIHYMSIDGNYLGSENKDQRLVLLPTNDVTIKHIWAEAKLTRPDAIERGGPANANAVMPR